MARFDVVSRSWVQREEHSSGCSLLLMFRPLVIGVLRSAAENSAAVICRKPPGWVTGRQDTGWCRIGSPMAITDALLQTRCTAAVAESTLSIPPLAQIRHSACRWYGEELA